MASIAAEAPSTRLQRLQVAGFDGFRHRKAALERWLEAERDQLPLWIPVTLGAGITAWFLMPDATWWKATLLVLAGTALFALAIGRGGRAGRVVAVAALLAGAGLALIWWRAENASAAI